MKCERADASVLPKWAEFYRPRDGDDIFATNGEFYAFSGIDERSKRIILIMSSDAQECADFLAEEYPGRSFGFFAPTVCQKGRVYLEDHQA